MPNDINMNTDAKTSGGWLSRFIRLIFGEKEWEVRSKQRIYRIRVRAGWEHIPEYSDHDGLVWSPLRRGMMGNPIGYSRQSFAQDRIENDKYLRSIPDKILDDDPSSQTKTP